MVQSISGLGIGGTGIVGTLIVAGATLKITNISLNLGDFAMFAGIVIGVTLGLLGIFGVANKAIG